MNVIALLFHDVFRRDPGESGFVSPSADRYKLSVKALEAQLDGIAAARSDAPVLVTDLASTHVRDSGIALPFLVTVDDGGVSYYTELADRLEARGWRGHCFVTTARIGGRGFLTTAQIRELDARGHVIGSHSATHPKRFSACTGTQMRREWTESCRRLEDILGRSVAIASVPGGYYSPLVARSACDAGIQVLFTSEPTTAAWCERQCLVAGRFTVRHGDPGDRSARIVGEGAWTRRALWASWNAKALVKPVLGTWYWRLSDRLHARRVPKAEKLAWPS